MSAPTRTGDDAVLAPLSHLGEVLAEVGRRVLAEDDRVGQQDRPDGTGSPSAVQLLAVLRLVLSPAASTWRHRLNLVTAAVCAARADDSAVLREHLLHVAAVCVAWAQALDRRSATTPPAPGPDR